MIYRPGSKGPGPFRPNKPTKTKPDRGSLNEQMPDYSEYKGLLNTYKNASYNGKGPFVNSGKLPPKRPWTKMVKKGY